MTTDRITKNVRVRVAPSPTGAMHLGLARTALYNWLVARHHGGQFVLRIDDTDRERNLEEALEPILQGLRWLGIDWDEGPGVGGPHEPYFQSGRAERHREVVSQLLSRGAAYLDYATVEETRAERDEAVAAKRPTRYSRRWMGDTPERRAEFESEGRSPIVRLRMPTDGRLELEDAIRGRVEFDWSLEQDHVIQRADGTCLYHLASVVDDHDLTITHVIRAEEHLSNTPRQVFIARSMGWTSPVYAHLPFVAEPGSRNKLSKRKLDKYVRDPSFAELVGRGRKVAQAQGVDPGTDVYNPVTVGFYEAVGFLPKAVVNYLVLLGWALDDRTEVFEPGELVREFSLERVNKGPASFDPAKLMAFQVRQMMALTVDERVELALPYLARAGVIDEDSGPETRERIARILTAAADRFKVAADILDYRDFFDADDRLVYEDKPFKRRLMRTGADELLGAFRVELAGLESFDPSRLEEAMTRFTEERGIKVGDIIHALRVAVTGKAVGFGMFETMAILGRQSCLARIDRALDRARKQRTGD